VLDERSLAKQAIELGVAQEVVVDPVPLTCPGRPRGRRHRQLDLGHPTTQTADHRPLADPGGPGDD
jgi:hypothetical protein